MKQVFIIIVCLLSACSGKNVFFSEENAVLPDSGAVRRDLTEIYHSTLSLEQLIEIAKERNENLKTVQTQIYRARDMLRKIYGKERQA